MQTRTVDNQILKLRKKIERTPGDPRHILTIHGVGYRFEP
jgi:two-component system alkaline phosphatase synthesis response regulator PhoP